MGIQLELSYKNGWGAGSLSEALSQSRSRDLKARSNLVGPHRADFEVGRDGERAADTLSRGQLKIANLALVLAQLRAAAKLGISPVLCLDDIGAELDGDFLSRVWQEVLGSNVQVLATGINVDRTGLESSWFRDAKVFHVKHGSIESK